MAATITNRPESAEEHLVLQLWGLLHQDGADVTGFLNMLEPLVMGRDWTPEQFHELVGELDTTPEELLKVIELKHKNERGEMAAGSQRRIAELNELRTRVRTLLHPALAKHGANQHGGVDIVNSSPTRGGNSSDYLLRRLQRDRPELAARVLAGELSPHAAMVEAGLRMKTHTIPHDPARAIAVLKRHFTAAEIARIKEGL